MGGGMSIDKVYNAIYDLRKYDYHRCKTNLGTKKWDDLYKRLLTINDKIVKNDLEKWWKKEKKKK